MRQLVLGFLIGILCLCAPANAGARSWYLALEGGVEFDGAGGTDTGWGVFAILGNAVTSHVSIEAELGYRSTSYEGWSMVDVEQTSLMFNGVYEAPLSKEVSVMLGAGIGGEQVTYDGFFVPIESEIELAAQLKLGLSIEVGESTDLLANYRYMTTLGDVDIDNGTLTVGVRFDL